MTHELAQRIKEKSLSIGFTFVGIAPAIPSEHAQYYQAWLLAGHHAEMSYLAHPQAEGLLPVMPGTLTITFFSLPNCMSYNDGLQRRSMSPSMVGLMWIPDPFLNGN